MGERQGWRENRTRNPVKGRIIVSRKECMEEERERKKGEVKY